MKKSIEQRAVDFAGDRSNGGGHGYPSWEATLIEKGYVKGAKDQKKLMYSEEEVEDLIYKVCGTVARLQGITLNGNHIDTAYKKFKKK
jgi:hypothetical protein